MTDDSRMLAEKSSRTSENRPSAACLLILGSSAVVTDTPMMAYGSRKRA